MSKIRRKEIVERVKGLNWYHSIDLEQGVVTPGKHEPSPLVLRALDEIDFNSKHVLDVGCWDGLWSFEAERRGASSITSIDDITQRRVGNIASTDEGLQATFRLAAEALGSKAEYHPYMPVQRAEELGKKYDVILFLGVLYHLRDMMDALTTLRRLLNDGGILVLESEVLLHTRARYASFHYKDVFKQDRSNWWVPTIACLEEMVASTACKHLKTITGTDGSKVGGPKQFIREALWPLLPLEKKAGRAIVLGKAFSGNDPLWAFPDHRLAEFQELPPVG